MSDRTGVVVTGIGVVNGAFAGGSAALGAYLATPRPPTAVITPAVGAALDDAVLAALIETGEARRMSRVSRFAVAAARLALADARVPDGADLGVIVGTEFGDLRSTMEFADGYLNRGPTGLSPLLFPNTVMNAMAAATSIAVRAREMSLTLVTPSVGGELAVARAAAAVASGRLPIALAGGVDQLDGEIVRWLARAGDPVEARGEGGTFLVVESRPSAEARGATLLGEILGWSWSALRARPYGVGRRAESRAIGAALGIAGITSADIHWTYRSTSGDVGRSRWEDAVLARALGGRRPSASLARVGQHAGLGALRVAAAAWTARSGLMRIDGADGLETVSRGRGLVHGLGLGGTQVALIVGAP